MVRGGEYFKVDIKVGIKMDYRGVIMEYFNELKVGRLDQRELYVSFCQAQVKVQVQVR